MQNIDLPIYGISVSLDDQGGGTITSDLHTTQSEDEHYNSAMDGIESLILACACSGIDIATPQFIEAIETSVEACSNNL